jgi:phosphoribosylglycinamide formyltransferase-1
VIHIAIFASGTGTNALNIINYFSRHSQIKVAQVLSNNPQAYVVEAAAKAGVPTYIFNRQDFYQTDQILDVLQQSHVQWIVLAGFLWLVPQNLTRAYPGRIINIHPALLPKFGGKGMYGTKVHEAVIGAKETHTGITIHLVNEHYDEGKIIFQAQCEVSPGNTAGDVAQKVQALEHKHFPEVIEKVILKDVF